MEPSIGVELASRCSLKHLGLFGELLKACETIGDALLRFQVAYPVLNSHATMTLAVCDVAVELRWNTHRGDPGPVYAEAVVLSLLTIACELLGEAPSTSATLRNFRIAFAHAPERNLSSYYSSPIEYGRPVTKLVFPLSLLTRTIGRGNRERLAVLDAKLQTVVQAAQGGDALLERISRVIQERLERGIPTSHGDVAEAVGLPPREFTRRLSAAGIRYRAVAANVVMGEAVQLLAETSMSVADIAARVGFSDQTAFTRAFRTRFGLPPAAFRRQATGRSLVAE